MLSMLILAGVWLLWMALDRFFNLWSGAFDRLCRSTEELDLKGRLLIAICGLPTAYFFYFVPLFSLFILNQIGFDMQSTFESGAFHLMAVATSIAVGYFRTFRKFQRERNAYLSQKGR